MAPVSLNNSMDVDEDTAGVVPASTQLDIDNLTPISVPEPLPVAACGSDENGRLIISHITNINFKSYAGTTILGPFQKVSKMSRLQLPTGAGAISMLHAHT